MDITKVLDELRRELDYLDAAILSLERLKAMAAHRRGRPPKLMASLHQPLRTEVKRSAGRSRAVGSQHDV